MKFIPYLMFQGNAEEAIKFYQTVFKGEIVSSMRFSENPEMEVSDAYKDKILHSELRVHDESIYFSDCFPEQKVSKGDQVSINIGFDSLEEIERVYKVLSDGVEVFMPLADTFWNAKFASFVDKFGIAWSLNYQYPDV